MTIEFDDNGRKITFDVHKGATGWHITRGDGKEIAIGFPSRTDAANWIKGQLESLRCLR